MATIGGIERRMFLVNISILLLCCVIFFKIIYIQTVEGVELREAAEKSSYRYSNVEAMRGNVLARDGSLLAITMPLYDIYMDVASPNISQADFNKKYDSLALNLSRLFGDKTKWQYKSLLSKARKKGRRYQLIKRDVDYAQLQQLQSFPILRRGKYRGGLITERHFEQCYPFGSLAKRTVGYETVVAGDTIFIGLEGGFSEYLTGVKGRVLKKRITGNFWVPVEFGENTEPKHGSDIRTTIDVAIQDVAEDALREKLSNERASAGCAILMEVSTGNIVAITNLKRGTDGKYREVYNYAIAQSIEPGSVFKLPSLMVALEDGYIDLADSVEVGDGTSKIHGRTIVDTHRPETDYYSVQEVFEHSSNVGVSRIINGFYEDRPEKFIEGLYDMSLNESLDLPIMGERPPFIKNTDHEMWSKVSLAFMSMGYEIQLTPLQVLTFYNAVANDGVMVAPRFVDAVMRDNRVEEEFPVRVINSKICSSSTIEQAQKMMLGVSEVGTAARAFRGASYSVAGKTGTAQIATNGHYNKEDYTATFAGYFPAENPKYTGIVLVVKPKSGKIYASSLSAPVFREIADKVYATDIELNRTAVVYQDTVIDYIPMVWSGNAADLNTLYNTIQFPVFENSELGEWVVCKEEDGCVKMRTREILPNIIPDVRGMVAKDAIYILENLGYIVDTKGFGYVKTQSISGGTRFNRPGKIALTLAKK